MDSHCDCATPTPRFTGPGSEPGGRRTAHPNFSAPTRRSARRAPRVVCPACVDDFAQRQRIQVQPVGELVDRLLEREDSLDLSRSSECRAGAGVREHVVLLLAHVRARIHHRVRESDAGAARDASGPVALECDRSQGPVPFRANPQPLPAVRAIACRHVLLPAIEHQSNRRAGLSRQVDREQSEVPDPILGAESAAGEVADDAHPVLRKVETAPRPRREH